MRESGYKFDNSVIAHFGTVNTTNRFYNFANVYYSRKYVALAFLLGADKSATDKGIYGSNDWTYIKNVIPEHYKTLSTKGLAHFIDIQSYLEEIFFDTSERAELKKQSAEVRQKKVSCNNSMKLQKD